MLRIEMCASCVVHFFFVFVFYVFLCFCCRLGLGCDDGGSRLLLGFFFLLTIRAHQLNLIMLSSTSFFVFICVCRLFFIFRYFAFILFCIDYIVFACCFCVVFSSEYFIVLFVFNFTANTVI